MLRKLFVVIGCFAVAASLAGCVTVVTEEPQAPIDAAQDNESAPTATTVEPAPTSTPIETVTAEPPARDDQSPEQVEAVGAYYLAMVTANLDTGTATDDQLLAAAGQVCDAFDVGASLELAAGMTVLELPADVPPETSYGITYAAARSICPEHEPLAPVE